MSGVTTDEVVNAFVDLAAEVVERQRNHGASTRPSLTGDEAIGHLAVALLEIAKRLQEGRYGP